MSCLLIAISLLAISSHAEAADTPTQANQPLLNCVICIDPGHPSETSAGTASRDGKLTENHENWVVGQRLRQLLMSEGATVVMTKASEHQKVTNQRRAEIANAAHADLMIRIHCDSGPATGFATYYPNRPGTVRGVTGPPADILKVSRQAALLFHKAAIQLLIGKLADRGIHDESATAIGAKQGALTGSIFARIPVITVEICVLTTKHDYLFARTPEGQETLAQALNAGVEVWCERKR